MHPSRPERPVAVTVPKLGDHRGRPRLWLEGMKLTRAGINPGDRFRIVWEPESNRVTLEFAEDGDRVVSKRARHNRVMPIIDVGSDEFGQALGEGIERAQVSIYRGRIVVDVHPDDRAAQERISRLVSRVREGLPLETGSLAHGGGIIDHAIHRGLGDMGVRTELAFAVEIEADNVDIAASRNPIWSDRTMEVHAPMEQVDPAILPKVDVLVAGIPCTGASKSGKAKNRITRAEQHPTAGMLVVPVLQIVKATNPSVFVLENVTDYAFSASADLLRATLSAWGYDVHETVLEGNAFGALETRNRLCLMAVSRELGIALDRLVPTRQKERVLSEIIEEIMPDDERWRSFAHHLKKAESDRLAGKNFKFNLIGPESETVGTMGAGYSKDRQTEPHVRHPDDPTKARLLTPREHARAKTIPYELVEGVSPMHAHRILGNSVVWSAWHAVGRHMGEAMLRAAGVEVVDSGPGFEEILSAHPVAGFTLDGDAVQLDLELEGAPAMGM